jgi:hypothetical protein
VDVDVDGARLASVVVAPDLLQQLVAAEDVAGIAQQESQQVEGFGLDRQDLAAAQQAAT